AAIFNLGLAADHSEAKALVLSCTDMRSVEIINRLEQAVGKPVISSNQAMMFQAMQLAGIEDNIPGYGAILNRDRL
ncbi:MAG: Asp/Glu racemase, partial [Paracoccaceae bacterium]